MTHRTTRWLAALGLALAACSAEPPEGPVEVPPASEGDGPAQEAWRLDDAPTRPGATAGNAIWVLDADGTPAGVLVRRGSDDGLADRATYDLVTVFHPDSGLFFEITMADGRVRYPATTFFTGGNCLTPVGVTVGGCQECRSGYGVGLLHGGDWWRVVGGALFEQTANGSTIGGGIASECVAHGTSNSKAYPVERVQGATPPTAFTPPLSFAWR